jgi:LmbE family N-acetylglucosaminyl deacetylase
MRWSIGEKLTKNLDKSGVAVSSQRKRFSIWPFMTTSTGASVVNETEITFSGNTTASTDAGRTLNIVAHADDDLLFLSPDLLHAIQANRTVRTVFLTAGDGGADADYWTSREAGILAAYAQMSGVANSWTQADAGIAEHPIPLFTLSAHPSVSLAFMRLPDGNADGVGFPSTNGETLQKLWTDKISTINTIDGSSCYSKATLTSTLISLISSFRPDQINTQDYLGTYGDGDHSDHHSVAYLVQTAVQQYTTPHRFTGYENYNTSIFPANVTGTDLTAKQKAFYAYAEDDVLVRNSTSSCYTEWLQRQYTVHPGWQRGRWRKHMPAKLVLRVIRKLYRSYHQWHSVRRKGNVNTM